jgi:hypothetical protein
MSEKQHTPEQQEERARLCAAAPDLLWALEAQEEADAAERCAAFYTGPSRSEHQSLVQVAAEKRMHARALRAAALTKAKGGDKP